MDPEIVVKYGVIGVLSVACTILMGVVRFLYNELKEERKRSDQYISKLETQRDDYRTVTIDVVRGQERNTLSLDQFRQSVDRNTSEVAALRAGRSGDRWPAQKG